MMIEISEFCRQHHIELPTGLDLSDLYLDIYDKYAKEMKEWEEVGSDGKTQKHYQWLYNEKNLKEYFKNEKNVL